MTAATILEIQVLAIKWAINAHFLMKFGTQTKTDMLNLTSSKAEVYGKKTPKLECKKTILF
jgi:hypothetical protein